MSISTALLSMTAAPSNVKNREIHKGDTRHLKLNTLAPCPLWPGAFLLSERKEPHMNDCQRRHIESLRKQGLGYKAIARKTKLSRDSVRNYCRWHHLAGYGRAVAAAFREEQTREDIGYGMEDDTHRPAEACGI